MATRKTSKTSARKVTAARKAATRRTPARKAAAKKATKKATKKIAVKRPSMKKVAKKAAKKAVAKKALAKKVVAKKVVAKKAAARKAAARKAVTRKSVAKSVARKAAVTKAAKVPAKTTAMARKERAMRAEAAHRITPEEAMETTRELLEAKQTRERQPPPWPQFEPEHGQPFKEQYEGLATEQQEEAKAMAEEPHEGESGMEAIQGGSRRNQARRDAR